jgi:hypothetical protein
VSGAYAKDMLLKSTFPTNMKASGRTVTVVFFSNSKIPPPAIPPIDRVIAPMNCTGFKLENPRIFKPGIRLFIDNAGATIADKPTFRRG